jgi:hypothetical protein
VPVHRPLLALIVFVGVVTALATWVAAALLGVIAPGAARHVNAVAVVVVPPRRPRRGAVRLRGRPVAEIAAATERLADGDTGVRVSAGGPGPVRGLQRRSTRWPSA